MEVFIDVHAINSICDHDESGSIPVDSSQQVSRAQLQNHLFVFYLHSVLVHPVCSVLFDVLHEAKEEEAVFGEGKKLQLERIFLLRSLLH